MAADNLRKLIFSINLTIDGFADHTAMIADAELHDFFTNLLSTVDIILFGRKTYQLMASYWPTVPEDPGSTKSEIEFARKYNSLRKIVFSKTLDKVGWTNSILAIDNLEEEARKLKQQPGKNISAGSISIASALTKLGLIDEYWFLVHPVILGKGKQLFEDFNNRVTLKLIDTKKLNSGVVVLHYQKI